MASALDDLKSGLGTGRCASVLDVLLRAFGQREHRDNRELASYRRNALLLRGTLADLEQRRREGRPDSGGDQQNRRVAASTLEIIEDIERMAMRHAPRMAPLLETIAVELAKSTGTERPPSDAFADVNAVNGDEQIFVSYSRHDRDRVGPLVGILKERGWSVFWDPNILPGTVNWDMLLDRKLTASRCIFVMWSQSAAASNFVRIEAHQGRERGTLLAATLDGTIPATFALVQTVNLTGWSGDVDDPRLMSILDGVSKLLA